MSVLIYVLAVVVCFMTAIAVRWRRMWVHAFYLPTVSGCWPIIGHLHRIVPDNAKLLDFILQMASDTNKQGGISKVWFGPYPMFCVTDPDDAKTVLNASFKKPYVYRFPSFWVGDGLMTGNVTKWKVHRKMLNPGFSQSALNGFYSAFNYHSAKLADLMSTKVGKGLFEHKQMMDDFILELICHTTFGTTDNLGKVVDTDYKDATNKLIHLMLKRFYTFWMHFEFLFKFTSIKREQDSLVKILHKATNNVVQSEKSSFSEEKKNENNAAKAKYNMFLDLVLHLKEEGHLSAQEAREELDTMVITGYETSSATILYTLQLLGSHPDVQEKLYDEITKVFGNSTRDVTKEDLAELPYLDAVAKESMRLFPAGPLVLRDMDKDVELKTCTIPNRSTVTVFLWGVNRHKVWGEDAEEFDPERWLDPSRLPENPAAFATFSLGKRGCIGRPYAIISVKVTLIHIIRRFRLKSDLSSLKMKWEILMQPVSGCHISLESRN